MCANNRLDVLICPLSRWFFFHDSAVAAGRGTQYGHRFWICALWQPGCRIEEAMDDVVSYSMNLNESLFKEMQNRKRCLVDNGTFLLLSCGQRM